MVRAVHLVGPGGTQHWIERSMGITNPALLRAALPATVIHYDDDWFNAAIATVGTLGLVYSVIMEVESQYDISETINVSDWPSTRIALMDPGTFASPSIVVCRLPSIPVRGTPAMSIAA